MTGADERSIAAGDVVTVVASTDQAFRRLRGIVTGSNAVELRLRLEPADVGLLTRGDRIGLVWAGGMFDSTIDRIDGDHLVTERPSALTVDDVRSVSRTATSIHGRWRVDNTPPTAVQLIDLSTRGTQIITEFTPNLTIGLHVELLIAHDLLSATIRRLLPADHPSLIRAGLQFTDLTPDVRRRLTRTVGSIKLGIHQWG